MLRTMKQIVALLVLFGLFFQANAYAAGSLYKTRGPLDKFRQFTPHLEFAVPLDIEKVRNCMLNQIRTVEKINGIENLEFNVKKSKKGKFSLEKYEWGGKYTKEISFLSGNGWTKVDSDSFGHFSGSGATSTAVGSNVQNHALCGRADPAAAVPSDMPKVLATSFMPFEPFYYAKSPKNAAEMVGCIQSQRGDVGVAWIGTTLEADHAGKYYIYFVSQYKNLGATVRENYAVVVSDDGAGSKIEAVNPGLKGLDKYDYVAMEKSNYAVVQIITCGGTRQQ
jgi:hypothetical protein